ncbi:hypothetical protein ENSA5_01850 [Enhygromyxa salina]|uniref:Uncharacterized protein n=1 Tax=Enhygromyxa salina TaxID=215803 RepID=A0A2S9YL77_9BACT|nr:hypothetical protein [Enhygromyxa salina]PRQ05865.1 hypothetical protein ENSA5_01850 [Enhygromyxa salina]
MRAQPRLDPGERLGLGVPGLAVVGRGRQRELARAAMRRRARVELDEHLRERERVLGSLGREPRALIADREGPLEGLLRLLVAPEQALDLADVAERDGDEGVVGTERGLLDLEPPAVGLERVLVGAASALRSS